LIASISTAILGCAALVALASPAQAVAVTNLVNNAEAGQNAFDTSSNAATGAAYGLVSPNGWHVAGSAATSYLNWSTASLEQNHEYASFAFVVRVNSHAVGESVDLFSLKHTASVNHFDFFLTAGNDFMWDLKSTDFDTYTGVTLGRWYLVKGKVFFGATTYTAEVEIDGVNQGSIASTSQTVEAVKSVWLGNAVAKTSDRDYDAIRVQVGETDPGWVAGGTL
jgi:hypothetical protein